MTSAPVFKLNTGATMPAIALGTWEAPNEQVAEAVFEALKAGYRHIDTAAIYGNEEGVGAGIARGLKELGLKRSDIFVTTKLWLTNFHDPAAGLKGSLEKLFPNDPEAYVDLYLMHWPFAMLKTERKWDQSIDFSQAYALMEKLPKSQTKAIGVSNFTIANLKKLLATATITPAACQIELHTRLPQPKLVNWLLSGDYGFPQHDGKIIQPEAYSPMARGNLDDPTIKKIAEKHNTGAANVVLSWGVSRKTAVLPKSVTPERIRSNLEYVKLDQEDVDAINNIANTAPLHRYCDISDCGFNIFNDNEDSK